MYNTLAASSRDNIFLLDEDIDRVAEKLLRPRLTTVLDGMLNTTSSLGE